MAKIKVFFFFKYFSKSVHCSKKGPGDSGNYATTCTPMVLFIVLFFYFRPLHMFLVFCCLRFFYMAMLDSEIYPPIIILYRVIQISASLHWTQYLKKSLNEVITVAKNSNVKNVPTKVQLLHYIHPKHTGKTLRLATKYNVDSLCYGN